MDLLSKCPTYQYKMLRQLSQLIRLNHNSFVKSDFCNGILLAPLETEFPSDRYIFKRINYSRTWAWAWFLLPRHGATV